MVIIRILAAADFCVALPLTRSVDIEDLSGLARHIPSVPSLCTRSSRAAVVGGNLLITQGVSTTITLGTAVQTTVSAFVSVVFVFTLILVDHRLVTRLGGGGHGGE